MKKTLDIKLILNLIFFLSFSNIAISQWAITTKNGTIGHGDYLKVDADCNYKACFSVYVYSPDHPPFQQTGDSDEIGFANIDPMFLRINIMGIDQTVELTNWTLVDDAANLKNEEIDDVYSSTICVDIELESQCLTTITSGDGDDQLDPNSTVSIPFTKELLTELVGTYIPYPICANVDPEELFSCEIFSATSQFCADPAPTCLNTDLYQKNSTLELKCKECILANQETGKIKGNDKGGFGKRNLKTTESTVSPNPFSNTIIVERKMSNDDAQIEMYNHLGQKVMSFRTDATQLSIPTSNFENGLYYLVIRSEIHFETFKILKQ